MTGGLVMLFVGGCALIGAGLIVGNWMGEARAKKENDSFSRDKE